MKQFLSSHKSKLILSSLLILLPMGVGALLWQLLLDTSASHWGANSAAGLAMGVFGMPLLLLAFHWVCLLITAHDPGNKHQSKKVFSIVFWIMPALSWVCMGILLTSLLRADIAYLIAIPFSFLGILMIVIGNYLPKCRQNSTMGIKLSWTLANEENWNATHRFAGKFWVVGGFLWLIVAFLPLSILPYCMIALILFLVLPPTIYSYRYYQKQYKKGEVPKKPFHPQTKSNRKILVAVICLVLVLFAVLSYIMFTGDVQIQLQENSFYIDASFSQDLTVDYEKIDRIEYVEEETGAVRLYGFNSFRLALGQYSSDALGTHTRYCYAQCHSVIVLYSEDHILVINGEDSAATRTLYDSLLPKLSEEVTQ